MLKIAYNNSVVNDYNINDLYIVEENKKLYYNLKTQRY